MVDFRRARLMRPGISLQLLAALAVIAGHQIAGAECRLPSGETSIVASVSGAGALALESGETLILSGLVPPEAGPIVDENWPPRAAARTELEHLVAGKAVLVAPGARRTDRYGNRLGQVFAKSAADAEPVWVQGELIAAGLARAAALETGEPCLADMLALEAAARADKRGNWSTGVFLDHDAGELFTLRRLHDTFQSIVGIVESIDRGRGPPALILRSTTGPNGAPDRATDDGFRAELPDLRGRRTRQARGANLTGLVGRKVRVRGWLEGLRHAHIVLADEELIEVLDPPPAGPDPAGHNEARPP